MESSPMEMYEVPRDDPSNNKENTVLRSLVGDPDRHIPLADHQAPSNFAYQENPAASMYTLETRYQPIPTKVLPKTTDPRVYYIDSIRREETPIMKERFINRQNPVPMLSEQQSVDPTGFLEPKIISQPIFYSIIDTKTTPAMNRVPSPPTLYAIAGRPRRPTVDMTTDNSEAPVQVKNPSSKIHPSVGSPRLPNPIEEPAKQPSPHLYSITGSPARASRGVQVNTFDPDQPLPILYTIIGGTPTQTARSSEKPLKNSSPTDTTVFTVSSNASTLKTQQQQPSPKPSLYTLVGQPVSSSVENHTRFERKREMAREEAVSYPPIQAKQKSLPKETKPPKSEAIFIPTDEGERRTRPPPLPSYSNSKPIQLSNYQTRKPYRERNYNNDPLPMVTHNHAARKPRPPLYEPRYQVEKHYPYAAMKPTSLERYPVDTKPRSTLWDNGYQTDDDEGYEQRMAKKKLNYKTLRPRAPWIPVW